LLVLQAVAFFLCIFLKIHLTLLKKKLKILILRFSSIGDIVLTSPVIRCLKQQLGAEVHFLTKNAFAIMQKSNPYLDKVYSFEKNTNEVLQNLKKEQYDWVIDLHNNFRSQKLKFQLNRPSKSFDKINVQKWLLVNFGINCLPNSHIVHRYMATVAHLEVKYDDAGLDFFIPEKENFDLSKLNLNLKPNQYTAFVIGATHATKRLPDEKIIEICKNITHPVVLLGGKDEAATGAMIATQSGKHIYNVCGMLNLFQSASVVRQAAQVVTHDTGLMHIAAAFNKSMVSIWGNTVPSFGMTPFFKEVPEKNIIIENTAISCRPCSKIGHTQCPKGHFDCMKKLENDVIIAKINQ
jgi:ADP-heptose:LPS heptosyltransferase